jgi:hypothetical protein
VYTDKKRVHRLIKRNKTREEDENYRRVGKKRLHRLSQKKREKD